MANRLLAIVNDQFCVGCGLCAAGGEMRLSSSGFLLPENPAPEAEPHCPSLNVKGPRADASSSGVPVHRVWGPVVEARTGYGTENEVRKNGSSGGAISAVVAHLLRTGAADVAVLTGRSPELPWGNRSVLVRDPNEILGFAGSRYAPSAPAALLSQLRQSTERFVFVGKPCDVAAVRSLIAAEGALVDRAVALISFFCAGIPSERGAEALLREMDVATDEVSKFDFRGPGWPGLATAERSGGSSVSRTYHESWGGVLNRYLHDRCKVCADGIGEVADIVCADAWITDSGYPDFGDRPGQSLILTRTTAGETIIAEALGSGAIRASGVDSDQIGVMQPYQLRRKQSVFARLAARRLLGGTIPTYSSLGILANARDAGLKLNAKDFAGMVLRRLGLHRRFRRLKL